MSELCRRLPKKKKYINSSWKLENTFAFHVDARNCLDGSDNPNPRVENQQQQNAR